MYVNWSYDMVVKTQCHKFNGKPFARVLCLILMKDVRRWLPRMLPGSTRRFSITILSSDISHYVVTRMRVAVTVSTILLHSQQTSCSFYCRGIITQPSCTAKNSTPDTKKYPTKRKYPGCQGILKSKYKSKTGIALDVMHSRAVLIFVCLFFFVKSQLELVGVTRDISRPRHRRHPSRCRLAQTESVV